MYHVKIKLYFQNELTIFVGSEEAEFFASPWDHALTKLLVLVALLSPMVHYRPLWNLKFFNCTINGPA